MRYEEFIKLVSPFSVFGQDVLSSFDWSREAQNLQFNRWVRAKKLIRLKRDLYTLPFHFLKNKYSLGWLSNVLYSPSYLSLEYALSYYDLIPERVAVFTSVSTNKTASFKNSLGYFEYKHVKDELFFGFEENLDEFGIRYFMASPEKAFLDYLYLKKDWEPNQDWLFNGLRLQQLEVFRSTKLKEYAKKYSNKKINHLVSLVLKNK